MAVDTDFLRALADDIHSKGLITAHGTDEITAAAEEIDRLRVVAEAAKEFELHDAARALELHPDRQSVLNKLWSAIAKLNKGEK